MKKTLTIITLLAGAVTGYSQGNILFNIYSSTYRVAVYGTQSPAASTYSVTYGAYGTTYSVNEVVGNSTAAVTTAELPTGTQTYAAGTALSGTGYDAALLVGPAGITTDGGSVGGVGLLPWGGTGSQGGVPVTFYTGPARKIGFASSAASFVTPNTSYFQAGDIVSVAIAAWSSTYSTLAAAQASGVSGVWGISPVEQTTTGLTTGTGNPISIPTSLESFSLGVATPEPSTIALGVMGVSALLFRRRK